MPDFILSFLRQLSSFTLAKVLPTVILIVAGIFAIRIIMKLVNLTLEKTKLEKAAHNLIRSVLRSVLYVLLGLVVASNLGIDVTGIVALASVLTLAISLSVQTALTNLIGGFTLLHTKPFVSGDFVEIAGQSGTVQEIGLTYTKLATADNKIAFIPNSAVTASQIINYTTSGTRRVEICVSASYDAPVDLVLQALQEAGTLPTTLEDPASVVAVQSYGESAINYVLRIWCKTEDYWTTLSETNRNIKAVFDARGISMTYPHLNVHLEK